MFTGLIEDCGTISALSAHTLLVDTRLTAITAGDSVAVNGICLTATHCTPHAGRTRLSFDVSPETFERTCLKGAPAGTRVNLERALRADSRLGGHLVSGHVETTGRIRSITRQGDFWSYTISLPSEIAPLLAEKGSVTVDGISLTVARVTTDAFTVAVIPHTRSMTTLAYKQPGSRVNLEPDLLMKYAAQALAQRPQRKPLTRAFLHENGFA